jgi:Pyridoxamine 5'-phosphate oxidase
MTLSDRELAFLRDHNTAAMITVGSDGVAKPVRVAVGLLDGRLWSSGTRDRVRTARLRHDPRCTLFVYDPGVTWLALETRVTILDGPDVPQQSLRLFRLMQRRPTGPLSWFGGDLAEDAFLQAMLDEQRIIYEFAVDHSYGMM